jgi:XTP/dITP diphosphohydrolase
MNSQEPILIFSSYNRDKIREYSDILGDLPITIKSLADFDEKPELIETGASLSENASIKARAAASFYNLPAFSDDSGLEVFALEGAPGVYSARYAGEGASYSDNVNKLLKEMKHVSSNDRGARFRTVICLSVPMGNQTIQDYFFEGDCEGLITESIRGSGGFGYDSVFFAPSLDQTFAEVEEEVKNQMSHRAMAANALADFLDQNFPFTNIVEN